ncbi:MAG TPA: O-antigen ligase family protein [Candidatus Sulfotelmatobacter sp.]|nr:O-antigen ligase family protein [Candidatus Sulfotelmatobacter sp.]
MMESITLRPAQPGRGGDFLIWAIRSALHPMLALMAVPSLLFLAMLTAMLLRHQSIDFYEIDRVAFCVLVIAVAGRAMVLRQRMLVVERITWPMLGLTALTLGAVIQQPFNTETWSLLASKFLVPFALFYMAGLVFDREKRFRQFEIYALMVLAYLSFTAIAFLVGARALIFPRFILDESIGFHADRARGPFLQAVANGVSLNILGLVALHAYRRGSRRGAKVALLLTTVPIAILATMTRAVWLSFAGTLVVLVLSSGTRALRRALVAVLLVAAAGLVLAVSPALRGALSDRLEERGPVDFRAAVYAGSWQMFLDRPILGWGFHEMPAELPRYVSEYKDKVLYPHNTYLEVLVELGLLGFTLYVWLMWELWRLGRGAIPAEEKQGFLDAQFHRLWPIMLAVYWVNAGLVVMGYQFVNALLFTMAGMLAAQRRRAEACPAC